MLPGQLQAQHGNDPGYQRFLSWIQAGGKHGSYAGLMPNEAVVRSVDTPWGENLHYDAAGNQVSYYRQPRPGEVSPYQGPAGPSAPEYDPAKSAAMFVPEEFKAHNIPPMHGGTQGQQGPPFSMVGDRMDASILDLIRQPNPNLPDGGLNLGANVDWLGGQGAQLDPFQNTIAARFLQRTQTQSAEEQQQMLRDFIKKVMLAGQQQRQPVSPGLISAAMGRVAV